MPSCSARAVLGTTAFGASSTMARVIVLALDASGANVISPDLEQRSGGEVFQVAHRSPTPGERRSR
jgi:hypothetical protein